MALFEVCKLYHTPPSKIFEVITKDDFEFTILAYAKEMELKYGKK